MRIEGARKTTARREKCSPGVSGSSGVSFHSEVYVELLCPFLRGGMRNMFLVGPNESFIIIDNDFPQPGSRNSVRRVSGHRFDGSSEHVPRMILLFTWNTRTGSSGHWGPPTKSAFLLGGNVDLTILVRRRLESTSFNGSSIRIRNYQWRHAHEIHVTYL